MAIDTTVPRTRRALLAGGVGSLVALVASALGRPLPARAGTDGDVVLGATNTDDTPTRIVNTTTSSIAIEGECQYGIGVHGRSTSLVGVWGTSIGAASSGYGVWGKSTNDIGVVGESSHSFGAVGDSYATDRSGVFGRSLANATGLHGSSGGASTPWGVAKPKTGVYGEASQDTAARGVWGYSPVGRGVYGQATSGTGTYGYASSGIAVRGYTGTGTGGYFSTGDPLKGYAVRAIGRVKLDQCAGIATIAGGTKSRTVTPGIDLVSTSAVVATLQGPAGGTTTVHRCIVDTTTNRFTIHLTANATQAVKVAWHVFG